MTEEKVAWNFFGETEIFTIFFNSLNAKVSIIYRNRQLIYSANLLTDFYMIFQLWRLMSKMTSKHFSDNGHTWVSLYDIFIQMTYCHRTMVLNFEAPTPQNGQTQSNNSPTWVCLSILWGWRLKGLKINCKGENHFRIHGFRYLITVRKLNACCHDMQKFRVK